MDGFPGIPNEIISEIFQLCLPAAKYHTPNPRSAPILLTHVCSSWGTFAVDTAALWQSLEFVTPTQTFLSKARNDIVEFKGQLVLWNQRRGCGGPVDLKFQLYIPYEVEGVEFWGEFIQSTISDNDSRLRKLYLEIDLEDAASTFSLPGSRMQSLETLHLTVRCGNGDWDEDNAVSVFSQAPNLRRVILQAPCELPDSIPLPWRQLTHLVLLEGVTASQFFFLAKECLLLEELSLKISDGIILPEIQPSLALRFLHTLRLTLSVFSTPRLFHDASFPSLQHFGLYCDTNSLPQSFHWLPVTAAHDHLYEQLRHLRSLKLGFHDIASAMLLEILRSTPLLEELALDVQVGSYPVLLEGLTYNPQMPQNQLLPRLQFFSLYVEIHLLGVVQHEDPNFPFSNTQFLSMIRSRGARMVRAPQDIIPQDRLLHPLKRVLLCVEKTSYSHGLNLESLAKEVADSPSLSDIEFTFDASDGKLLWLEEKIETW